MSDQRSDAVDVLRTVWAAEGRGSSPARDELDEACGPTKACKNMQHVSFDGLAEPGSNLREAWRERLAREGKLDTAGGSIRDLVLGSGETR